MSGPMGEGPLPEEERNVVPEGDDGEPQPIVWRPVMADSGTHWVSLNPRNGGRFDRSRGPVEDAE